jgi:Outer membrane protein beta-barrel domain
MKKLLYLFLFHIILINIALAQSDNLEDKVNKSLFRPFAVAGINAAQVDGDDVAGYTKVGVNAGVGTYIMLPKNFSVGFELLYSQKGALTTKNNPSPLFDYYKLNLDYLDVPIMVSYHDKQRAIFGLGVVVNNLIREKETRGIDPYAVAPFLYNRLGLEGMANVSFHFTKKFGVNLRFAYSLTDIARAKYVVTANGQTQFVSNLRDNSQRNNYFTARIFYLIR